MLFLKGYDFSCLGQNKRSKKIKLSCLGPWSGLGGCKCSKLRGCVSSSADSQLAAGEMWDELNATEVMCLWPWNRPHDVLCTKGLHYLRNSWEEHNKTRNYYFGVYLSGAWGQVYLALCPCSAKWSRMIWACSSSSLAVALCCSRGDSVTCHQLPAGSWSGLRGAEVGGEDPLMFNSLSVQVICHIACDLICTKVVIQHYPPAGAFVLDVRNKHLLVRNVAHSVSFVNRESTEASRILHPEKTWKHWKGNGKSI